MHYIKINHIRNFLFNFLYSTLYVRTIKFMYNIPSYIESNKLSFHASERDQYTGLIGGIILTNEIIKL